jgi:hypothetical protein
MAQSFPVSVGPFFSVLFGGGGEEQLLCNFIVFHLKESTSGEVIFFI